MNSIPVFLSNFSLNARIDRTIMEPRSAYKPVVSAILPETLIGKNSGPIPMEKPASTMLLPMASPMAISYCLFRTAVKSTTSSGRDVPMATKKKLMKYSGMRRTADKVITDSITIKDPTATPMKPRIAKSK